MILFVGYSKGPEQLQSAATTTSAGREPATIHIGARCTMYYATGEDDMNIYCKLNMDCSPLLPSCEKSNMGLIKMYSRWIWGIYNVQIQGRFYICA